MDGPCTVASGRKWELNLVCTECEAGQRLEEEEDGGVPSRLVVVVENLHHKFPTILLLACAD